MYSVAKYRRDSLVTNDYVVPRFHLRSAQGEVFNNPYSKHLTTMSVDGSLDIYYANIDGLSDHGTDNGKFLYDSYQSIISAGSMPVLKYKDEVDLARNAQIQCLSSVNKTEFDSLTFGAEWSKTKVLHRQIGQALLKLFIDPKSGLLFADKFRYKRARVKRVPLYDDHGRPLLNRNGKPTYKYSHTEASLVGKSSLGKDVANAYLVGRYGVGPLLHDLESALKSLSRSTALRKTARGSYTISDTVTAPFRVAIPTLPESVPGLITRSGVKTVRYGLFYETSAFMSGAAAYGFTRPLSTVWELIPYSFVFDWLINVGAWLDAIQPSGASKTLSAWVSTRFTEYDNLSCGGSGSKNMPASSDWYSYSATASLVATKTTFNRSIWDAATPTFPSFGSGISPLRSFDFMTLVVQRIRSA